MALAVPVVAAETDGALLRELAVTRNFTLGRPSVLRITSDGSAVVFLRGEARSPKQALYELDLKTGLTRTLLTVAELSSTDEVLSPAEKARRERQRVSTRGFTAFQLSRDDQRILVTLSGRLYLVQRGKPGALPVGGEGILDPQLSPDGERVAFVRERDLWVLDLASKNESRLTVSRDPGITHGAAEFVAQEEMERASGFWWSSDSKRLAFEQADCRQVEKLHVLDLIEPSTAPDGTRYPRAGKTNCAVRLGIVPVAGGTVRYVDWDHARFPYLALVRWADVSAPQAPLLLLVETRDQREVELLRVSDEGRAEKIHSEQDAAWINLDPSVPRWLPDGHFLWSSERGGAWQLELRSPKGLVRSLTGVDAGYERLVSVDTVRRRAFFVGGPDPRDTQFYAISLDGGAPLQLSVGDGAHAVQVAASGRAFVDSRRSDDEPGRTTVFAATNEDYRRVAELPSVAVTPPFVPKVEYLEVGPQKLWTSLVRPRNVDPKWRYSVLCAVYGGPHARMVRRGAARFLEQWIADQGFVVVSVDGRGTPRRGREWERAWQPGSPRTFAPRLDDQVEALRLLGARFPELDLSRVAIEGWSFGGWMSAFAVLRRPDIFRVAVAGAPVVDWRDYDTHYTERYLGLPSENQAGYDDSSLLANADKLRRPLLLLHGTSDDNVYFLHSLKLADALFRAGKPVELLALPGLTHMVADPVVSERLWTKVVTFLKENLR